MTSGTQTPWLSSSFFGDFVFRTAAGAAAPSAGGAVPRTDPREAPLRQNAAVLPLLTGVYRSDDGGASWKKVSSTNPRPMYFSQMRVDPNDANTIYMGGVGLHQTLDASRIQRDCALKLLRGTLSPQPLYLQLRPTERVPNADDRIAIAGGGEARAVRTPAKTCVESADR